jgi:uncharacterized membrane protein
MTENTTNLPAGAGASTGSGPESRNASDTLSAANRAAQTDATIRVGASGQEPQAFSSSGSYQPYEQSGTRSQGREVVLAERQRSMPSRAVVMGAALVGALAGGAIPFMLQGRSQSTGSRGARGSGSSREGSETTTVEEAVVIAKPARALYDFWRNFENLPQFMENVRSVKTLDATRSHWVIEAPAGTSVEFDSRITQEVPGALIAWESEPGASVSNRGLVEFIQAAGGSETTVRATISYEPPAGAAGRLVAKLFQREPSIQAHRDLKRFKELMETGRIEG